MIENRNISQRKKWWIFPSKLFKYERFKAVSACGFGSNIRYAHLSLDMQLFHCASSCFTLCVIHPAWLSTKSSPLIGSHYGSDLQSKMSPWLISFLRWSLPTEFPNSLSLSCRTLLCYSVNALNVYQYINISKRAIQLPSLSSSNIHLFIFLSQSMYVYNFVT